MPPEHEGADPTTRIATPGPGDGGPRLPALTAAAAPPRPARPRRVWVRVLAGLGVVMVGAAFFLQPWSERPVPVSVETVAAGPVTRVLAVNGQIAALHSVEVRALVGGRLADVPQDEGDRVAQGAVLARIDAAGQQAIVQQALAGLDTARVAQARARDTLLRAEALGANVARTELEAAGRALQTADQDVARAAAAVDQSRVLLDNHTVRAPMAGTILALNVEPGQNIDPATVLMTIADLDRLVVEADVDEAYATRIRAGLPAVLQLAGENATRPGSVVYVSQRVDTATGGLALRLEFDTPVRAPVGLTVTTNVIVERHASAITAPRAAIRAEPDRTVVFVVAEGAAVARPVSVIDWPAARLVVTRGLAPGDLLVTDAAGLSDGQSVRVTVP